MTPARPRPAVRPIGLPSRGNRIRRATAILTPVRAGAALLMILSALAIYGVGSSSAFAFRRLDFDASDASYTSRDTIMTTLGLDSSSPNLFLLRTDDLESRLRALPPVVSASVSVELPDTLVVRVAEREPVVVWNVGGHRFLVDASGLLFAPAPNPLPADVPVIQDRRAASTTLNVGSTLDPVDLDAATRLVEVTPKDIGSQASELRVVIQDGVGFTIQPVGVPWIAQFGVYTPTLRPTTLIPGQVRLLHSFLVGREMTVKTVTLADDRNGTYVSR